MFSLLETSHGTKTEKNLLNYFPNTLKIAQIFFLIKMWISTET